MEADMVYVDNDLPAISDNTLIQLAEQAEARVNAMQKIKNVALSMTNKHDWVDQGGKPYLQASGSEKIARLFGVSWRIDEPMIELEEGGHFSYTYKGEFRLAGSTIEAIGTRSSKDGFFKKYSWDNGGKTELPASAIDRGDVKKSAYTNLLGNGITRLLGIRNLTYGDLEEFAGITNEMITQVDYKSKGKTSSGIASEDAQETIFCPLDIRKQSGTNKKTGKAWEKFIIKSQDAEYSTFSESFAKIAKEAREVAREIKVVYKVSQYGNDVESITFDERIPGEDG